MAKTRTVYRCTDCGAEFPKWAGRCESCSAWNTLVEEVVAPTTTSKRTAARAAGGVAGRTVTLGSVTSSDTPRWRTGLDEFDFVLGGGIVPGSMVLVGGEPGIGKSTLLLQVAARLEAAGQATLYVSGEESALQVRLRAERLAEDASAVSLLTETSLETILATAAQPTGDGRPVRALIVDSIQTVHTELLEGAPGNVGQVRECAARLMRFAKDSGTTVFVIGHVTKGGGIAGPKTLEHIVDTVLYFEGDSTLDHRVLRATKNRFGSVDEIGVFRMVSTGLIPVDNPSALFVGDRREVASGSAVCALMEGTRPVLVEVQALAAKAGFGTPQRVANGIDARRLALLLAVLDKRGGFSCAQLDVFCNVVGGMRVQEPSVDLAVVAALASSVVDKPLPSHAVFLGELGLGGEVRPVSQAERRLAEAAKLGMTTAFMSDRAIPRRVPGDITVIGVRTLVDVLQRTVGKDAS
ncbi:DNA repair protein RadA [Gemmatimonas aurantiaca T-27]|uniref:DNA repair protein RadA n=1 Tax=Gemmatimonas aurantiaca (strain DSM 14586 / JCM 11422 / NBRC 100505 / T-27) TaxID=379066 RepID=C1A917_GEMAT|nr:DNA repair protein RadA [Gemmatimonas aurantiaca]BAH38727.1 DNA repair protein RadA [Gemmatimonas aurantiaca T-27]